MAMVALVAVAAALIVILIPRGGEGSDERLGAVVGGASRAIDALDEA
ncbi:MAG: hypothetical protein H0X21_02775, partial [Actinobacteria bacterium]|nr:hypothetical protein [Actinomycetota bacterium]